MNMVTGVFMNEMFAQWLGDLQMTMDPEMRAVFVKMAYITELCTTHLEPYVGQ